MSTYAGSDQARRNSTANKHQQTKGLSTMNIIYEAWIDPGNGDPDGKSHYIEAESEKTAIAWANNQSRCWPIGPLKKHPTIDINCADGQKGYRLLLFPPESSKDQAIIDLADEVASLNHDLKSIQRTLTAAEELNKKQNAAIARIPWDSIDAILNAATDALDRGNPGYPNAEHIAAVNTWLKKQGESA